MADATSTSTVSNESLQKLVRAAAGVVAGSQKVVGVSKAMEVVGFTPEQRQNMRLYQQVHRKAQKLSLVDEEERINPTPPTAAVEVTRQSESEASSLTGSS